MTNRESYVYGLSMLTPYQMQKASEHYEMTPCEWLWQEYNSTGPNMLSRFVTLCYGLGEYMKESLFQAEMDEALRLYGRTDFNPVPSQAALVGMALMWASLENVLDADASFRALTDIEDRPLNASVMFISMRATLILLRRDIHKNPKASEFWYWLCRVGWDEILTLAEQRDHAALEMIAGRAFCEPEGCIAVLPPDWSIHAAA
ncbi:hypothetical protein ACI01nite_11860 [Acetobacter cibinongensis]|uniref:Uncharacterized protein n=1 Tax=Acetobacter cibinongensis TaxID=146475 RepID=A0A0D6N4P1_9PROT|nr:hypothetical protein [Acetobacter cibinongensis]GAN60919.1 hypothetical protein Abci_017_103 [Acetobacter cibinongensis]GBQ13258.1 hypothetical protein AA0482_0530 [Acetobacter cibinongensis NRIC 0482]GEL58584.1 hypothetical protein ACI01nite_11860 [Acetobacter cibinongensis]